MSPAGLKILGFALAGVVTLLTVQASGQTVPSLNVAWEASTRGLDFSRLRFPEVTAPDAPAPQMQPAAPGEPGQHGIVSRSTRRVLRDQGSVYLAPFRPRNFKWDALVLIPTGVLVAEDRHIQRHLPGGNLGFYNAISNATIGTLSGTLAVLWIHGIKTDNPHGKELGELELEALVNTFLIYAPMQFIAGRQRPGEGNGHGDFLRHHNMNTSFPGGHAMFTWAMATVAAHEYPKPWVKALAYGAAFAVTTGRFLGRDHWSSDMFVGAALGYFIGAHVFRMHCDPELSTDCHRWGAFGIRHSVLRRVWSPLAGD